MSGPSNGAHVHLTLRLDATLAQVRPTVRAVGCVAGAAGLDAVRRARLELALAEILGNVVRHGHAGRSDGVIDVRVESNARGVCVEVRDRGRPIQDVRPRPPQIDVGRLEGLPESGRGLWIVHGALSEASYSREDHANVWRLRQEFAA